MKIIHLILAAVILFAAAPIGRAEYISVDLVDVPLKRLLSNLYGKAKLKPKDAQIQHRLARAHAMAYAKGLDAKSKVKARRFKTEEGVWFGFDHAYVPYAAELKTKKKPEGKEEKAEAEKRGKEHLESAIERYENAIELKAKDTSVERLGLAWCQAEAGKSKEALAGMRKLVEDGWKGEKDDKYGSMQGSAVSEAIGYLVPLLDKKKDAKEIAILEARKKKIDSRPRPITPIVLPLRDGLGLGDIADPDARVAFDLDGSGFSDREWQWIRPEAAGWLVHDPRGTGAITSAIQMFGSRTFTMFFENGYEALALLDDNGDGELRGAELRGLSLWVDRNSDGVSDEGEVRPLAEFGVVGLGCEGVSTTGGWIGRGGVRYEDGSVRDSFDVVLEAP